jgi:hypothetical protein
MPDRAANSGDTALAGRDGERLTAIIDRSETKGSGLLQSITRNALQRHLTGTGGHYSIVASGGLFSADETQKLSSYLAAVIATGDLLGRTRLREKMAKAIGAGGLHRFAEADERPFAYLPAETVPILPPTEAARYFARLVPSLGVDVIRYGEVMQRAAFTMALATEKRWSTPGARAIAGSQSIFPGVAVPRDCRRSRGGRPPAALLPLLPKYTVLSFRPRAAGVQLPLQPKLHRPLPVG